jgi:hypothetical protein
MTGHVNNFYRAEIKTTAEFLCMITCTDSKYTEELKQDKIS